MSITRTRMKKQENDLDKKLDEVGIIRKDVTITYKDLCKFDKNLKESVYKYIENLPQDILIEDALKWLDDVSNLKNYDKPDTLENRIETLWWHLKRLPVLGGSEIYDIVAPFLGKKGYFNNIEDIFKQKRMKLSPVEPNQLMIRGTILEQTIAKIMRIYHGFYTDSQALEQVSFNSLNIPDYPFLGGNPDDIVVNPKNNELMLIDYKAPSEVPEKVSLAYVYQLHNYNLIYSKNNEKELIQEMRIVFFDYKKGNVNIKKVPLDMDIINNIKEYGKQFWEMVCDPHLDKLPEFNYEVSGILNTDEPIEETDKDKISTIEEKMLKISALEAEIKNIKKEINEQLNETLKNKNFKKEDFDIFNFKKKYKISDEDGLKLALKMISLENGISEDEFKKTTSYLDKDKLSNFLNEHFEGLEISDFMKKTYDMDKILEELFKNGFEITDYLNPEISATIKKTKVVKEKLEENQKEIRERKVLLELEIIDDEVTEAKNKVKFQ